MADTFDTHDIMDVDGYLVHQDYHFIFRHYLLSNATKL